MAKTKFTELPEADPLDGSEIVPIVQGGVTKRTTVNDIRGLTPNISLSPSSLTFGNQAINTISASQQLTASGSNLIAPIVITAPAGFIINDDNTSTNKSPISLTPVSGNVSPVTIYVKFAPTLQQNYTGNISATSTGAVSRSTSLSGVGVANSLDVDAAIYLNAAGIQNDSTLYDQGTPYQVTGAEITSAINNFFLNCKAIGPINNGGKNFWNIRKVFHFIIGANQSARCLNLFNPGTNNINLHGTWTYTDKGYTPDGLTAYADFGISPSDLDMDNTCIGRWNGPTGSDSRVDMGVCNTARNNVVAVFSNYSGKFYYCVNGFTPFAQDDSGLYEGAYWLNRIAGESQAVKNGAIIDRSIQTALGATITDPFYYGALNQQGTATDFDTKQLMGGFILDDGLSRDELLLWYQIVHDLYYTLHRAAPTAYWFGDSITAGNGILKSQRFSTLVCASKGWMESNHGVQGTTMESAVPVNRINSPNMYDNVATLPKYLGAQSAALFINYVTNDVGLNYTTYNTTVFGSQMGTVLDSAIAKSWPVGPTGRLVCIQGFFVDTSGFNSYLTYGIPSAGDDSRNEAFITQAASVCLNKNVIHLNPKPDMNGATGPDGLHPDASQNATIANTSILPNITFIT